MPSPSILDFDALLAPIPGNRPAGAQLSLLDRNKLKEMREDIDPEKLLADAERIEDMNTRRVQMEQIRSIKRKKPQWAELIDFAQKYLSRTGKDLYLALTMTEALTLVHGFAGLRDGLKLVRRLTEEAWDRLHPEIDPDDPESVDARCALFAAITVVDRNPFFPNTIRAVPILERESRPPISTADCLAKPGFRGDEPPLVSREDFEQAVKAASPAILARVQRAVEDMQEARSELQALDRLLEQRAGNAAPSLRELGKAIEDVLFRQSAITQAQESDAAANEPANAAPDDAPSESTGHRSGAVEGPSRNRGGTVLAAIASREDAYARLEELAGLLEKFDPHSPVPFLIRRALEMRTMRFPELVDALTRDARVMDFLRNPLGSTPTPTE